MRPRTTSLLFVALTGTAALTSEALAAAPRYRMVLDAGNAEHGVQTVSLVANPAIQRGWVALSEADPTPRRFHLSTATEGAAKQVLTGPALLPGQEILRLDAAGQPFYITFDAATIEGTARQFAAQARHTSTNQDHAVALAGNVVYESWLVADPANDKAAALGLDVPAGTWMLSVHIPDADYWQNEVVSGNKLGFSIEGLFDTQQLNLSAAAPAPTAVKKNWVSALLVAIAGFGSKEASAVTVALGLAQLADGRAVHIDDTTGAVTVSGADGMPGEVLADGSYPLKDGGELVVQGGLRADGEGTPASDATTVAADKQPDAHPAAAPATEAAPAPLAADASPADIVGAINALIKSAGGKEAPKPDPTTAAAAPKVGQALHGVALADVASKLTELKLDAIELVSGDKLTLNPVSKRLSNADGSLVESGWFAAADGSYFSVSTDQWFYQIDKQTYDSVYKLAAVQVQLAQAQATTPASGKLRLSGHAEQAEKPVAPHLAFLQAHQAQLAA